MPLRYPRLQLVFSDTPSARPHLRLRPARSR